MLARILILVLLWSSVSGAGAVTVYRKVMPDGTVKFSDEPFEGSETIEIDTQPVDEAQKELNLRQTKRQQRNELLGESKKEQDKPRAYKGITISSPQSDQIIRSNGGILSASVSTTPPLAEGDEIVFYIDGATAGKSTSAAMQLTGVGNGLHHISAAILSGGVEVLRSEQVEFHLLRQTAARNPGTPGTPGPGPRSN